MSCYTMGMKWAIGSLLILCIGILWFMYGGNDAPKNYPPKNPTIVAFGDSLVEGVGASKGNDLFTQLGKRIGRPIVNLGVGGNTTADGVARMNAVTKLNPGLVILVLGGNDTLRRIPVETTEANLRTLITTFQSTGAVVMFLGVRGGIIGSEREDVYERLANELGALYVPDILDGILLSPELMYDGIHPNDAGYARIAERLEEVFEEYELN
jgi:acyl-CoA thioesterase I